MKSLSILIPIYNEEESLQALFDELKFSFENNQSIEFSDIVIFSIESIPKEDCNIEKSDLIAFV